MDQRSVVLPLSLVDGEPVLAFDLDAPAGTYKELEISVDKLVVGHLTENPLIEVYPDLANASILVSGTVIRNGAEEPFVSAYDADIALELDLTPHLIVTTQNSVSRFSQLWSTCQAGSEAAPVSSWILQILRTARLSCPTFSSRSRLHCHDSVRKLAKNSRGPESEWAA